jgi:signal transduction histidine kinase/CheY-like chemotaxis protein/GGDEF domain-containing protein
MGFLAGVIIAVLFINGTISSLREASLGSLQKNSEIRSISLENLMLGNLSNLDRIENEIINAFEVYSRSNSLTEDEILGDYQHEVNLLSNLSLQMINSLRLTSATGIFMYFTPNAENILESHEGIVEAEKLNGLYYRDLYPRTVPADNSDIMFLRGYVNIARKDGIQLDSTWSEQFVITQEKTGMGLCHHMPLIAAAENVGLGSNYLSYWNTSHLLDPSADVSDSKFITYTRPVIYNGRVIALVGTEMQVDELERYFPASDFGAESESGYMLVKYNSQEASPEFIEGETFAVAGNYIKRILGDGGKVRLTKDEDDIYKVQGGAEAAHVSLARLRLYKDNAPFASERWALASVGTDSALFAQSKRAIRDIIITTLLAVFVGTIVIAMSVRYVVKPLNDIVGQIKVAKADENIVISGGGTYEIILLCDTINAMREKRRNIEERLKEDKERYLIALESAAETFIEYDTGRDTFTIYYFNAGSRQSEIITKEIACFSDEKNARLLFHKDDVEEVLSFIRADNSGPIEVRGAVSYFPHIFNTLDDEGYFWFELKASCIYDENGLKKLIGIARQITSKKIKDNKLIEAAMHDITTGFYNRDYGTTLVESKVVSAIEYGGRFVLCVVRLNGYDNLEAHYGRFFSAVALMRFAKEALAVVGENISVRLNNYEFMFFFQGEGRESVEARVKKMRNSLSEMYMGENKDLKPSLSAGYAVPKAKSSYESMFNEAYKAAQHTGRGDKKKVFAETVPIAHTDGIPAWISPISISVDASQEGIVGLAFDLFEHTTDIESVTNILLAMLGDMFSLTQIIICSYDADFGVNQVSHQWNAKGVKPHHEKIEKVSQEDLDALEQMLDENSAFIFNAYFTEYFSRGVKTLLCVTEEENYSAICCAMYEGGVHTGRVLFKAQDTFRVWSGDEMSSLNEITKIVSAHLSIQKSNSASKAKSEFLSRMSHEIRTPMNAIIGMTVMAKEFVQNPERLSDCLEKIDFSAHHLLALINDVLEMSRIESGKLIIKDIPFSLTGLVRDLDILMRPQIEGKGITFIIELSKNRNMIIGDEYRLKQVLVNFLGNASKFTDAGKSIKLTIEEKPSPEEGYSLVRFSVKDTGIGISREDQPNVFKSFEQVTNVDNANIQRQGTGLGLAISNNIITAMGSRIELNSELGQGSEFFFTLKLKYSDEAEKDTDEAGGETTDYRKFFEGKKVLLVDDNELNIEIANFLLTCEGFDVETASNGREAADKFFASPLNYYDAILMDIQMPVMDGLTATREIRKNTARPDAKTVPIVAMTADAFDEDMKKSVESGMNGHISKPVDSETLYRMLLQLLCP